MMKVVILAGGLGTRISEETAIRPKPMVEVGPEPILWHIMKIYSHQGFHDFVICAGYKQNVIKNYFSQYIYDHANISVDMKNGRIEILNQPDEPWNVTVVDTGLYTQTGGRVKKIKRYVEEEESFMLTYGDGLSDINLAALLDFHLKSGKKATLTAVQPQGRYGIVDLGNNDIVSKFNEKPKGDNLWVNGGYYVLENSVFDYITGDETAFEVEPLQSLTQEKQLSAYKHNGFWKAMDTMSDRRVLEDMWNNGKAPWKIWK